MGRRSFTSVSIGNNVRRRTALFALIAVGALQFVLAAHQFQHVDPQALGDTCDICLKTERFDEAVAQAQITVTLLSVHSALPIQPVASLPHRPLSHYSSRAPPIV